MKRSSSTNAFLWITCLSLPVALAEATACSHAASPDQTTGSADASDEAAHPTADAGDAAPPTADGGVDAQCGVIYLIPPMVMVRDSVTGQALCDATFTCDTGIPRALQCAGQPETHGCPLVQADGAVEACQYSLVGLANGGPYSVVVSAPGYEDAVLSGVSSGQGGCGAPYVAPSEATALLKPLGDAGDGGGGD